jgi:hypothetical protein
MTAIFNSTGRIRTLARRMAEPDNSSSERAACWEDIYQELEKLDAQALLIAETLKLLGRSEK